MGQKGRCEVSLGKLIELRDTLKNKPKLEVGVFGDKTYRNNGEMSNADIACVHENGAPSVGIPARSFLKTPLFEHKDEIMAPFKGKMKELIQKEGIVKVMKAVGVACLQVVDGAFKSGGYGKWVPLKGATLMAKLKGSLSKRKNTLGKIYAGQVGEGILIDSRQLQRSMAFRVRMTYF